MPALISTAAASAAVTKWFVLNTSETTRARNFKIYRNLALDSLYIYEKAYQKHTWSRQCLQLMFHTAEGGENSLWQKNNSHEGSMFKNFQNCFLKIKILIFWAWVDCEIFLHIIMSCSVGRGGSYLPKYIVTIIPKLCWSEAVRIDLVEMDTWHRLGYLTDTGLANSSRRNSKPCEKIQGRSEIFTRFICAHVTRKCSQRQLKCFLDELGPLFAQNLGRVGGRSNERVRTPKKWKNCILNNCCIYSFGGWQTFYDVYWTDFVGSGAHIPQNRCW